MTDAELHELAQEFFQTFARCENALKSANFLDKAKKDASADWTTFAQSVEDAIANPKTEALSAAVTFILGDPPKKQINKNGQAVWVTSVPESKSRADLILLYVRRIRNNLFHGGKFNGHWFEPARSEQLLKHGLIILRAAVASSARVKKEFG